MKNDKIEKRDQKARKRISESEETVQWRLESHNDGQ